MKVVVLDALSLGEDFDFSALHQMFSEVAIYQLTNQDDVLSRLQNTDVVLTNKVLITADLMDKLNLRYIGILATGMNNVDVDAATSRGIVVKNVSGYSTDSVAQHCLMYLLALLRKLPQHAKDAKNWDNSPLFCIHSAQIEDVNQKKVAIYGYGDLGKAFAKLLKALGIELMVLERKGAKDTRSGRVSFEEGVASCDVLSIHCPLDKTNVGMFNKSVFDLMKNGSYFINSARGPLVNDEDLVQALESGKLAGVAIDVLVNEPPHSENKILNCKHPNLLLTPHVAWASDIAIEKLWNKALGHIEDFLNG